MEKKNHNDLILNHILHKLSETPHFSLNNEQKNKLTNMLSTAINLFKKHRPAQRFCFLNYSYVLNKLFRIMDMDYFAMHFFLLKSKNKLKESDNIWSKICTDAGWVFHSSM